MSDLEKQMAKGAAWLVLLKLIDRSIGLISTLFLARLLVPADFGLVAMVFSVLAALELLSAFSFDLALVQNQNAQRHHYDTAWSFALIFGCFNALTMCLLASTAATFYGEPRIEFLMYVLALSPLIQGFDNIGIVAFQKDLQLHKEFQLGLTRRLVGFSVTLLLAFVLHNYWALVAGILSTRLTSLILSYRLHPYRPRFSMAASAELFHFSKWLLMNNMLSFLNTRGTDFIIGKMSGASALGLYTVSYEISSLPTTELVYPISRAVFPGYARLAGDKVQLRRVFLNVIGLVALLTIPAGAGIGLVAEPLVQLLLGPNWAAAVSLIQVLAMFGIVRSLNGPSCSVYVALGKPRMVAVLQFMQLVLVIGLMLYLVPTLGAIGAAWALLAGICAVLLVTYILLLRDLSLPLAELWAVLWRPLVAAAVMTLTVSFCDRLWPLSDSQLLATAWRLLGLVLIGGLSYGGTIFFCWYSAGKPPGTESVLLALVISRFRKKLVAI